ncbi:unnamed protein product [Lasius platythorax]|uniref:Uncharacterized protein n=1 Tax=Lasius platythorax TaxID=488582 RepID=A0AAV2NEX8_9HYME
MDIMGRVAHHRSYSTQSPSLVRSRVRRVSHSSIDLPQTYRARDRRQCPGKASAMNAEERNFGLVGYAVLAPDVTNRSEE